VGGPARQMQVQCVGPLADQDALARQRDAGGRRLAQVRKEHTFPQRGARHGFHVLHVEHGFGEAFIENAGLNLERGLRALEPVLQIAERCQGTRRQIDAVDQGEHPRHDHEDRDHPQERPDAQAAGAHGRNFAVRGQTAQPNQDSDQHPHGNGVGQGHGNTVEEDLGDAGQRGTVAND